jgi:hypothetical protein
MSDVGLIVIMLAAFGLAIGLVRGLDRLISKDAAHGDLADEPPDTRPDAGAATDPGSLELPPHRFPCRPARLGHRDG